MLNVISSLKIWFVTGLIYLFLLSFAAPAQVFMSGSDTIYKDEDGKIITKDDFFNKQKSGNYSFEPEIVNGKMVALKLKKGRDGSQIVRVPNGTNISKVELPENSPLTENIKKATFEKVWNTINEKYWDTKFNGVDWNAVRNKYEPQLAEIKTNIDLNALLNNMLGELKQSHLRILPPENILTSDSIPNNSTKGTIGISARLFNKREMIVTSVREESPAARAGIKPGFLIRKVDGQTIEELIAEQKRKGRSSRDEVLAAKAMSARLLGTIDKKVSLTFVDENDEEKTIEIERQNAGEAEVFQFRKLNDDVGYIKLKVFVGNLENDFANAIAKMNVRKALIIDLRENPGGMANLPPRIAAKIDKGKHSLGVSQYRNRTENFEYEGNDKSFNGRIYILIDELSGSSSEVLAGGLQALRRAVIVGRTSTGAVLPSSFESLPNGAGFQYAIADFKTSDGKILEGVGVVPDVEVKFNRKEFLAGKDPFIETVFKLVKQ